MSVNKDRKSSSRTVKQAVESRFSQSAANYAASEVHRRGAELEMMIALAAPSGSESVLDAGCGPGHTALRFAPYVRQVTAVDLSEEMLAQGRLLAKDQGVANIEFRRGDVENLPFSDGAFDLIVTRYSAHHWPSPKAALSEFRRLLRADKTQRGQLLLADVVSFEDYTTDTHLQSMEVLRDPSHVRDHTVEQWLTMLEAAGFEATVKLSWELRLDFQSWIERNRTPASLAAAIRTLLLNAPSEVQDNLQIEADCSFTFQCALIQGAPLP